MMRCDAQGRALETLKVNRDRFAVSPGQHRVRVGGRFTGGEPPAVKCEFRTVGQPRRLGQSER
jgi:hypothetical protein